MRVQDSYQCLRDLNKISGYYTKEEASILWPTAPTNRQDKDRQNKPKKNK